MKKEDPDIKNISDEIVIIKWSQTFIYLANYKLTKLLKNDTLDFSSNIFYMDDVIYSSIDKTKAKNLKKFFQN